ncbi:phytosulfokines-like [Curcuma longa]|uniref:phytosulfokines-like n=1 Tax=Curcuma longa TaxID=136217 RepID=UPI003D9E9999
MMSKFAAFFVLSLLLLNGSLRQAAEAALEPADDPRRSDERQTEALDEECGGEGEEECLMRRTLVAHTDYIYTQNKQP